MHTHCQVDWGEVLEELLPLIEEALESDEAEVRRNALLALRKSVSVGDAQAMPLIRKAQIFKCQRRRQFI